MMRSFGPSFRSHGVDFLLISGQATVLYGASTFSEDIDLWVRPTAGNLDRLRRALRALHARAYKLTPPLTLGHARKGHGFHFVLPSASGPVFLDVMGRPPRVTSYGVCKARAVTMATEWGRIPVLSIPDLVEIKKTRRLGDYDVISALVRIRLVAAGRKVPASLLVWALRNSFVAEDLGDILARHPAARRVAARLPRKALKAALAGRLEACRRAIAAEVAGLQRQDLRYWNPVLADLRRLRASGGLLKEGAFLA